MPKPIKKNNYPPKKYNNTDDLSFKTPSFKRRVACMLYESILVFGIVFTVGLIYALFTQQKHALNARFGLQITLFLSLGLYFVIAWVKTGQTLAMKTWHLTLMTQTQTRLTYWQAILRYLGLQMAYLPSVLWAWWLDMPAWIELGLLLVNLLVYFTMSIFLPRRQALHDQYLQTGIFLIKS